HGGGQIDKSYGPSVSLYEFSLERKDEAEMEEERRKHEKGQRIGKRDGLIDECIFARGAQGMDCEDCNTDEIEMKSVCRVRLFEQHIKAYHREYESDESKIELQGEV